MSKASWLWPYRCRKGAQRPDLQQCKLPVKEGSIATWRTIYRLWPYCCRKGAQWPDLQQCKLTVKEGSTATWRTILLTVSQTIVGREQSDLMDNTICSCTDRCWKGAKWPDGQHYLQLRRPLLEGSKATWWKTLSAAVQTVVGREQSDLMDNTICCCTDHCRKGA